MRDLLIVTPTRNRPNNARRLAEAVRQTRTADTVLLLAVDDDDPSYDDGIEGATVIRGPRRSCPEWTNSVALEYGPGYRAVASLGDDHFPVTSGWDAMLLAAIGDMGDVGIAYGDDTLQHENLPTAPVISTNIILALGWMFHPGMRHYFCDNVWKDIASGAGCLRYLPDVVVKHTHYTFGTAVRDQVYADTEQAWNPDAEAYQRYRDDPGGLAADVARVRELRDA